MSSEDGTKSVIFIYFFCFVQVMDRLFEIPEDYWINFISDEVENMYPDVNTPQTPEVTRGGRKF